MAQYVNNADFLQALKDYKLQVQEATDRGEEKPILSNYIGECILKIEHTFLTSQTLSITRIVMI